jgi:hypothetical protein
METLSVKFNPIKNGLTPNEIKRELNLTEFKINLHNQLMDKNKRLLERLKTIQLQQMEIDNLVMV